MDSSKIFTGCGIGCAILIVLGILTTGIGYFLLHDTVEHFEKLGESIDQLENEFGEITDYIPDSDGKISPDRIEIFLEVRSQMLNVRRDLEEGMVSFSEDIKELETDGPSFFKVVRLISKGVSGIPYLIEFYAERYRILMAQEMSPGEYYYLYVLIYPCWLQKSLEDGPEFRLAGDNRNGDVDYGDDVYRERKERYVNQIRRNFRTLLKNQLEAADALPDSPDQEDWVKKLNLELTALQEKYDRIPWGDGLPEVISSSLEPFRADLVTSYSRLLNPLELGLEDH